MELLDKFLLTIWYHYYCYSSCTVDCVYNIIRISTKLNIVGTEQSRSPVKFN